ncbi:MAG: nicotinate-nucleotide adenylyltransferase [Chloroflexota bacterium]|nr:nicotinate-nucleotide adenylyltransferase [Chloroflexota bacterium]
MCEGEDTLRLGVLGGTFDPPHYGHLALAETARVQLGLDCVLFVPSGHPPHKSKRPLTPAHQRVALVEVAIADNSAFALSRVDLDRPGLHYTVEMLALLRREYPAAELFFLMGGDSLAEFLTWRDPAGIVRQARLAVMRRPGDEPDLEALERAVPGLRERLVWLDAPCLDIAASDLRRRARAGLPLRYLVPPPVEACIREFRLYEALPGQGRYVIIS